MSSWLSDDWQWPSPQRLTQAGAIFFPQPLSLGSAIEQIEHELCAKSELQTSQFKAVATSELSHSCCFSQCLCLQKPGWGMGGDRHLTPETLFGAGVGGAMLPMSLLKVSHETISLPQKRSRKLRHFIIAWLLQCPVPLRAGHTCSGHPNASQGMG